MNLEEALEGKEFPDDIRANLILVDLEYCDFGAITRTGQMVVHRDLADEVRAIFEEIAAAGFPIEKIQPVTVYDWSDDDSMAANNSSAFNYRFAVGKEYLSQHSYGRAIDINPVQNPYIRDDLILPPGAVYDPDARGALLADGPVVAAFERRGWTWGGRWTTLSDWHHFEKPELSTMNDELIDDDLPLITTPTVA